MPSAGVVRLTGSVGGDGDNHLPDVRAMQHLINAYPPHSLPPLLIDGRCGPRTITAIEAVERQHLGVQTPDGKIDPNGPTLKALNMARKMGGVGGTSAPSFPPATPRMHTSPVAALRAASPSRTGARQNGHRVPPRETIVAAQKSQLKWRVRASISIAQWILESGWGRLMPAGSNNAFGIKAAPGQPFVIASTREEIHGRSIYIKAPFRVFASINEAFDEHGKLLAHHPAYALARAHLTDPDAYARALTGHYATDSSYGDKLISFMRNNDLYQYNNTFNYSGDPNMLPSGRSPQG